MSRRTSTSRESGSRDSITPARARLTSRCEAISSGAGPAAGKAAPSASSDSSSVGAYLVRRRRLMQKLRAIVYSQVDSDDPPRKSFTLRAAASSVSWRTSFASSASPHMRRPKPKMRC